MESGIQSSFIPRDAGQATLIPRQASQSGLGELGLLVALVLLVASGALAGAVFLYEQYAKTSEASKVQQLQRAKDAFEPSLIQDLTRLDDRMRSAEQVLSAHMAPTELFDALQQATLSTVSFQTLDFSANDTQRMNIKMSGIAEGVNSVALQADLFSKNGVVTNPIFSDISRQPDGVHFNLSALVNPAAVNYVQLLNTAGAVQTSAAPAQNALFGPAQQQTGIPTAATTSATGTQ
ncbi:MAG: hypothetical protein WC050_03030 [Candidatus Paceibacterota bacterium]